MYAPASSVLVVDVQADLVPDLGRRVVLPLLPPSEIPSPVRHLHPVIRLNETSWVLATHRIASIRTPELGRPRGNLAHYRDEITRALDMLLIGF